MTRVRRNPRPPMDRCTKILSAADAEARSVEDRWPVAFGVMCGRPAVEVVGSATLCAPHAKCMRSP